VRFTEPAFLTYLAANRRFQEPVLEVGAGWTPDFHRAPLAAAGYTTFLTQDAAVFPPNPPADFVCDVCDLAPIETASVGTVLCFNLLEHCYAPWRAVQAIRRVLKPGGAIVGSVPLLTEIHRHNRDYWRFCPDGVAELLREFRLDTFVIEGNPALPSNLLFAATHDPSRPDWHEHNETVTAAPLVITDTDYLTENPLKKAVVRMLRRFGFDLRLWSHNDDVARMNELGYTRWQLVPRAAIWPSTQDAGSSPSKSPAGR
jgi:SAM-dependent methyltransferase